MSDHYIFTTISKKQEYYPRVIALIEESFKYPKDESFETDFYPLLDPTNYNNLYILLNKEGDLLAHIGLLPSTLGHKEFSTPVCLIGGVSVNSNFRGQGLLKTLLYYILDQTKGQFSLFLLWSDLSELYEKFKFFEVGEIYELGSVKFSRDKLSPGWESAKWHELKEKDFSSIKSLYKEHYNENSLSIIRDQRRWDNISNITSSDLYLYKDGGELQAYFVINKGADLTDTIHECAYKQDKKDFILNELSKFKLWVTDTRLQKNYSRSIFTSFVKIGDIEKFKSLVSYYYDSNLELLEVGDINLKYKIGEQEVIKNPHLFLTEMFHPRKALNKREGGKVPLTISGLDSI